MKREVIRPYWKSNGRKFEDLKFKEMSSDNVNKKEVIDFLNEVKPDIIFAMCVNDFFGKKIRAIPKYGGFIWHEGLTPEYKGLYCSIQFPVQKWKGFSDGRYHRSSILSAESGTRVDG